MEVLLVIDGSPYSQMIIGMLRAFKLPRETQVTVMTVVPEHKFLGGLSFNLLRSRDSEQSERQERQREQAVELVESAIRELGNTELELKRLVRWGNTAEEILKAAAEEEVSLILIGAKGLTGSSQFTIGSVAQKVIRYTTANVLMVRKETTAISRVLIAVDGSKYSEIATQFLLQLPLPDSEIMLVAAVQSYSEALSKIPTLDLRTNPELISILRDGEEKAAQDIITRFSTQLSQAGYRVSSSIMHGGAAESILKVAKENSPDLIVIGAKGLTGIKSFLLGNVAEKVAASSECSVLICRSSVTE
jgi:nucleotide-binding universal stress UspA family protein